MPPTTQLPLVHDCAVDDCAFNSTHRCHAGAITISGEHAHCGTFILESSVTAGSDRDGQVGACHRSECVHNEQLSCTADAVSVGPAADAADCLTFQAR